MTPLGTPGPAQRRRRARGPDRLQDRRPRRRHRPPPPGGGRDGNDELSRASYAFDWNKQF
jgi:hypothetical protein